jgi:hypothetical protein
MSSRFPDRAARAPLEDSPGTLDAARPVIELTAMMQLEQARIAETVAALRLSREDERAFLATLELGCGVRGLS